MLPAITGVLADSGFFALRHPGSIATKLQLN
jgi:hypothetical protein